jgi:hypothetical protein
MRPVDGDSPLVYSMDEGLAPRILSQSPKVHAMLWLQRMDASASNAGPLDERLNYLQRAAHAIGAGASAHARIVGMAARARDAGVLAASVRLNEVPSMGLVS